MHIADRCLAFLLLALCLLIYVAACSALPLLVPSVLSQRLLIVSARLIRVAACSAVLSRCFILLLSCVDVRSWRGGGLIAQAPVHPIRAISVWRLPSPRAKRVWGSPPAAPPQPGLRGRGGAPPKGLCPDLPARGDALQGLKLPLQVLCPHSFTKSLSSQRAKTSRAQMHSPASPPYRLIDRTEC